MLDLNSDKLLEDLRAKGISVYNASQSGDPDVLFDDDNISEFIRLIDEFKISIVFMQIVKLEEYEIEGNLIAGDFEVQRSYVRNVLQKHIDEFNRNVNKLRKHIGKEQSVILFFFHQGVHFSYEYYNYDLYPEDKKLFLKELLENYADKIEESKEKMYNERQNYVEQQLEKMHSLLMIDEKFKACKNRDLRRAYIYKLLGEHDELKNIDSISSKTIMGVVEEAWRDLKLQNVL